MIDEAKSAPKKDDDIQSTGTVKRGSRDGRKDKWNTSNKGIPLYHCEIIGLQTFSRPNNILLIPSKIRARSDFRTRKSISIVSYNSDVP